MSPTVEFKGLLRSAKAQFRTINRSENFTKEEKKLLKAFYLEHILATEAQRLPRPTNPTNGNPAPAGKDRWRGRRLLTARDLEDWLKIDVKTIYAYVTRKIIPYVRIQSNVRFRENEIRRWLTRHNNTPASIKTKHQRTSGGKAK